MSYYPEQDETGNGALPTYDELAAQKGPNSRFGRWKNWVEKRAAERYIDITPEERIRRRERGWGDDVYGVNQTTETLQNTYLTTPNPQLHSSASYSSFWSGNTAQAFSPRPPSYYRPGPDPPNPPFTLSVGQPLLPSHLKVHHFGSRFLPHTTSPMNALLPLMGDRLLLIGHDNGLSVLDMFPSGDPSTSSPADAQVRPIWEGEGVYQLELLEFQETGDATPQGVVLALMGAEVESQSNLRERDVMRSIRMYNLSSLTSLARWASTQKNTKPLDLRRPPGWNPQLSSKKHKHTSSINKLKLFISDSGSSSEPTSSYPPSTRPTSMSLKREASASSCESSWDVVDELPLRWATDYVPLASTGSRLLHQNVLFFELQRGSAPGAWGSSSLAVATKQSILLYETPKNERAFRFVKEFYTPLVPRNLSFVYQDVQETVLLRSPSSSSQRSVHLSDSEANNRRFSLRQSFDAPRGSERVASSCNNYGAQMSLFVVFDKKAGLIRLADSAVIEVELYENSPRDIQSPSSISPRRSFIRESKGYWLPPSLEELPLGYPGQITSKPVYLLTRGKQTQIIPYPIPSPLSSAPPLHVLTWNYTPSHICHRICSPLDEPYFLQVIALGEYGVEVQEVPMSVFTHGKGKGRYDEPVRAEIDIGGDMAYLCRGGQWHEPQRYLSRSDSFMSTSSAASTVRPGRQSSEDGFYATVRKGVEDWRVIWLGGSEKEDTDPTDM